MIPTKRYHVVAMHAIDGQVLIGEFGSKRERDDFYSRERAVLLNGGYDSDTRDICRGEVHGMAREAEEAELGVALRAQMQLL